MPSSPIPFSWAPRSSFSLRHFQIASKQNLEMKFKWGMDPRTSVAPLRDLREPEVKNGPTEQQAAIWGCGGLGPGLGRESIGQDPPVNVTAWLHSGTGEEMGSCHLKVLPPSNARPHGSLWASPPGEGKVRPNYLLSESPSSSNIPWQKNVETESKGIMSQCPCAVLTTYQPYHLEYVTQAH